MKWATLLDSLICILFTVLFFADYFPESILAKTIPQGLLLLLLLGMFIGSGYLEQPTNSFKTQLRSFLYIIFLVSLFTLLGGKSQIGFSFDHYFFWISCMISLVHMLKEWKKIKKEKLETVN